MQPTGDGVYPPQGSTPRDSVYSDRAVFALSPQRSNTPSSQHHRESLSLPPTAPPAVYAVDSGSNHNHRHQQAASLPPVPPKHVSTMVALSPRRVLHLNQSSERPSPFEGGISFEAALAAGRGDAGAHKTYALPPGTDIAPSSAMQQTHRIRIERDYSAGDARQFALRVPDALAGRIDHQKFIQFVSRINAMLAKAEGATARNVLEGCLAYATLYLSTLVIKPHYKRAMDDISRYVYHENTTLFKPAGLLVIDPKQTAYMFIEIISL
ncbi:Golgin sub A member 7 [Coemansia thaxteri]|nr:Golgin sub A member 7 [Coemansia thaxteri]